MSRAIELIRRFRRQRVLVLGDAMLDIYFEGTATRLCAEGPVPVVDAVRKDYVPGGAANTAVNTRSLGAQVAFLSAIGADESGDRLRQELLNRDVSVDYLIEDRTRRTMSKLRIYADRQFMARFDDGDTKGLDRAAETQLIERLRELFVYCNAVIVSDYLHGVISPRVIAELRRLNQNHEKTVVLDSKNLKQYRFCNVSVITPNHLEAQRALDLKIRGDLITDEGQLESIGRQLLEKINTRWAIVTMGAEGAQLFERGVPTYKITARPVENPQVVGAGDTFTSALTLTLAAGADIHLAAEIASEAAAIAVGKKSTAVVTQQELLQRSSLNRSPAGGEPGDLLEWVNAHRLTGKTVVFTNGCFDGLHAGHIVFLRQAKGLGDVLIVGVNSDASVKRVKGAGRPLYNEKDRLSIVVALDAVDYAVLFDEDSPERLIGLIKPDIHVKGGDYQVEDLPEVEAVRRYGGKVVILPLEERDFGHALAAGAEYLGSAS